MSELAALQRQDAKEREESAASAFTTSTSLSPRYQRKGEAEGEREGESECERESP